MPFCAIIMQDVYHSLGENIAQYGPNCHARIPASQIAEIKKFVLLQTFFFLQLFAYMVTHQKLKKYVFFFILCIMVCVVHFCMHSLMHKIKKKKNMFEKKYMCGPPCTQTTVKNEKYSFLL